MPDKRIALVTGGNQGIGLQVAKDLVAHGFTVLIGSRQLDRGEAAAKEDTGSCATHNSSNGTFSLHNLGAATQSVALFGENRCARPVFILPPRSQGSRIRPQTLFRKTPSILGTLLSTVPLGIPPGIQARSHYHQNGQPTAS